MAPCIVAGRVSPVWRYRQIWRYRAKSGKGWRWAPPAQLAVNRAAAGRRRQRAASLGRPHRQLSRLSRDEFRYSPMGVLELLQAGAQRRRAPKRPATYLDSLDDTDQGVQAAITTLLDHVIKKVESAESGSGPSRGARSNCSTAAAAATAAVLVIDLTETGAAEQQQPRSSHAATQPRSHAATQQQRPSMLTGKHSGRRTRTRAVRCGGARRSTCGP